MLATNNKKNGLCFIVTGDFNYNLTNPLDFSGDYDCSNIIFGMFNNDNVVVPRNESFT